jgi:hypothetical protein
MEASFASGRITVGRFSEQDFLSGFFAGRWRRLPWLLNGQERIKTHHPDLWALSRVAVIHSVDDKPWTDPDSEDNKPYQEVQYWWHVLEGREREALRAVGACGAREARAG